MAKNDGGPAFPAGVATHHGTGGYVYDSPASGGMSLRDWFAGQATMGWIIVLGKRSKMEGYTSEGACAEAARLGGISADAMLAEREKR